MLDHTPHLLVHYHNDKSVTLTMTCSCGGYKKTQERNRHYVSEERILQIKTWREHYPDDKNAGLVRVCERGHVHTGQAHIRRKGQDHLTLALSTELTPQAWIIRGFEHPEMIDDVALAVEMIIERSDVESVVTHPWYDLDILVENEKHDPYE